MTRGTLDRTDGTVLRTPRLLLRPPTMADAAAVARLADNPKIALQTARMPYPYRDRDAEAWIARANAVPGDVTFVILDRGAASILGAVGYGRLDESDTEVGYWIGQPFWGRGFATEAVQAVIDHAFFSCCLARLAARCRVDNRSSRRVLEKCGFQYQGAGMVRSQALTGSVATDDFCLERTVWESLKRWGRHDRAG